MTGDAFRRRDLAKIHLAKKELGLQDDAYRELLKGVTGKTSSADLTATERMELIRSLEKLGAKSTAKPYPGRPPKPKADVASLTRKIEAQLTEAKRPWAYANAMAKRMFGVEMVQWCDADQLGRIVAALTYDARRHGRDK